VFAPHSPHHSYDLIHYDQSLPGVYRRIMLVRIDAETGEHQRSWYMPAEWRRPEEDATDAAPRQPFVVAILPDDSGGAVVLGTCNPATEPPCNFIGRASESLFFGAKDDPRRAVWHWLKEVDLSAYGQARFDDAVDTRPEVVALLTVVGPQFWSSDLAQRHVLLTYAADATVLRARPIAGQLAHITFGKAKGYPDFAGRLANLGDGVLLTRTLATTKGADPTTLPSELLAFDQNLQVRWRRQLPPPQTYYCHAPLPRPVLLNATPCHLQVLADERLFTLSAWGFQTNTQAGACAGLAADACDDGDPCTVDGCEADVGCGWRPAADGDACGDGATCKLGACVSSTP
jgi:hypothetical protein